MCALLSALDYQLAQAPPALTSLQPGIVRQTLSFPMLLFVQVFVIATVETPRPPVFASLDLAKASTSRLLPGQFFTYSCLCLHIVALFLKLEGAQGPREGVSLLGLLGFFLASPQTSQSNGAAPWGCGASGVDRAGSRAHSVALLAKTRNQALS